MESKKNAPEDGSTLRPKGPLRVATLYRVARVRDGARTGLSPQEIRLLQLLVEGHRNKTAAAELGICVQTVGSHLRSIYGKLGVHTRAEAVARGLRDGLIRR